MIKQNNMRQKIGLSLRLTMKKGNQQGLSSDQNTLYQLDIITKEKTAILVEVGNEAEFIELAEPYEQVKQKIMDTERTYPIGIIKDCSFTREEYKKIFGVFNSERLRLKQLKISQYDLHKVEAILDKLNGILKEDNE